MSTLKPKTQFLVDSAAGLLQNKTVWNSFWQNIAYNFYPQRAYFTRTNPYPNGSDFASNLTTSFPILIAREYTSLLSSYLRPAGQRWVKFGIANQNKDENIPNSTRKYLEWATDQYFNFINDRESNFEVAINQGDADFGVFGQCAISIEIDWNRLNLLHRCWNLRDIAWREGSNGLINYVCREDTSMTIRQAYKTFPGEKLSKETLKRVKEEGDQKLRIMHIVMETDEYYETYSDIAKDEQKIKLPYVSIFVEIDTQHEIEVVGSPTIIYYIPRDQIVSGSQYAYSRVVAAALPDARLLQSISLSLLEAGEKAVNPPIVAKEDAIRSDIGLMANTISWVADSYNGKIDDAIKVMNLDRSGLQYGLTMQADTRMNLKESFLLNKLTLPQFDSKMTATEVRQRYQEWIRGASPFVSRLEKECNQQMCKMQFDTLRHVGAFGPEEEMPEELLEKGVEFTFNNPLVEARGSEKGQKLLEMGSIIANGIALDPTVRNIPDIGVAIRDTLEGLDTPAKWLRDEEVVDEMIQQEKQQQQAQQFIQTLNAGAQAAEQVGKAGIAVNEAGIT